MRVLFIDTETTGLDSTRHEVWEFAAIEYDSNDLDKELPKTHHHLVWEPTWLENADPGALQVNHYYDRMAALKDAEPPSNDFGLIDPTGTSLSDPHDAAEYIAWLCSGALLVANNPGFDNEMLTAFCRSQSHVFAPFHRKINVVDMALGVLRQRTRLHPDLDEMQEALTATALPHSSRKVLDAAGCPKNENPHTALGDARHVRDAFFHLWGDA